MKRDECYQRNELVVVKGIYKTFDRNKLQDVSMMGWRLGEEVQYINEQPHILVEFENSTVSWIPTTHVFPVDSKVTIIQTTQLGSTGEEYLVNLKEGFEELYASSLLLQRTKMITGEKEFTLDIFGRELLTLRKGDLVEMHYVPEEGEQEEGATGLQLKVL